MLAAALILIVSMTAMMTSCSGEKKAPQPQSGVNAGPDGKPAAFREPVRLSSKDGVLEVRLSAHQGTVNLDTVKEPVDELPGLRLRPHQGHRVRTVRPRATTSIPRRRCASTPARRLIVHYDNDLQGLTIQDFYDPAFTPDGR